MPSDTLVTTPARKRGRPKGSRNRRKPVEQLPTIRPAALRVPEAAQYLSVSVSTIRRLIRQKQIEAVSIGTAKLVLVRSLDALLERGG
jgi:excisionase family DNA binding protein